MKLINIVVNGQLKEVEKREYSFSDVIRIAFGTFDDTMKGYTMSSSRKNDDEGKHSCSYSFGDMIKMKEGMRFNVDSTNRS